MTDAPLQFLDLPDDVLGVVIMRLPSRTSLAMSSTCTRLRSLVATNRTVMNLSYLNATASNLQSLLNLFTGLTELAVGSILRRDSHLILRFAQLSKLSILRCGYLDNMDFLSKMKPLTKLCLKQIDRRCRSSPICGILRVSGLALTELVLTYSTAGMDQSSESERSEQEQYLVPVIAEHNHHLQKLHLAFTYQSPTREPLIAMTRNLSKLHTLVVPYVWDASTSWPEFAGSFASLTSLTLQARDDYVVTLSGAIAEAVGGKLRTLHIYTQLAEKLLCNLTVPAIIESPLFELGNEAAAKIGTYCPNLVELNCGHLSDKTLAIVAQDCPQLRTLTLSGLTLTSTGVCEAAALRFTSLTALNASAMFLPVEAINMFVRHCRQLKQLWIRRQFFKAVLHDALRESGCQLETYRLIGSDTQPTLGTERLEDYLASSSSLRVFECRLVRDPAAILNALARNHPHLRTLRIYDLTEQLTLPNWCMGELEELEMHSVSAIGLASFLPMLSYVRVLRLGHSELNDDSLWALAAASPCVTTFSCLFANSGQVTDTGVMALLKHWSSLKWLDIRGQRIGITNHTLESARTHPKLQTITLTCRPDRVTPDQIVQFRTSSKILKLLDE